MTLNEVFNGRAEASLIYRGDCTKRGFLGKSCFEEGKRFELIVGNSAYTFMVDKITVIPVGWLTDEHFNKHINGHGVSPLFPSDLGPMNDMEEPCTVVEFRRETGSLMPLSWRAQQEHHPA